jgi:hypothetical protein
MNNMEWCDYFVIVFFLSFSCTKLKKVVLVLVCSRFQRMQLVLRKIESAKLFHSFRNFFLNFLIVSHKRWRSLYRFGSRYDLNSIFFQTKISSTMYFSIGGVITTRTEPWDKDTFNKTWMACNNEVHSLNQTMRVEKAAKLLKLM